MHIVITFPYYLALPGGGPMDCCQTARHLSKAGVEVTLIQISGHAPYRYPNIKHQFPQFYEERKAELESDGVKLIPVEPSPTHYFLNGIRIRNALQEVLSAGRVHAVLGWDHEIVFLPRLLKAHKIVFGLITAASYSMHGGARTPFRKRLQDYFFRTRPLRVADVVFARSNFTRDEVHERFGVEKSRIKVTYCGVNRRFGEVKREFNGEVTRFLYYGWYDKGAFDAVKALSRVAARGYRNWSFKVVGWGNKDVLMKRARRQKIGNQVTVLGRMDQSGILRELEWADVAILPSRSESFGLAIAEAQASGLPVISYEAGAIPEVVERNATAWLVPRFKLDDLADAIIAAIQDPRRTFDMGLAGRQRVTTLFTWQRVAETMIQGIESTMSQEGHRVVEQELAYST